MPRKAVSETVHNQPIRVEDFKGQNNSTPPERCKLNEFQVAANVNITSSGQIKRRGGRRKVYSGDVHSFYKGLFREGTYLKILNSDNTATTLRTGISGSNKVNYLYLNNLFYYSDEFMTGVTNGLISRTWGLEVPASPILAETVGDLPPGRYLCTLTFVRNDYQESGAGPSVMIDITQGGISISKIPTSTDPTVFYVNIYLSRPNGGKLYLAGTETNGTTSFIYRGTTKEFILPCATQFLSPPPPGHLIAYHNGRIYIAQNNNVYYTEPYNYELVNLAHNLFTFDDRVTLLAPVKDGIWLSIYKKETFFAAMQDPETGTDLTSKSHLKKHPKTLYGAIEGTQQPSDDIMVKSQVFPGWYWTAEDGIHYGIEGGYFQNVTMDRYTPVSGENGTAMIMETWEGETQYISAIFDDVLTGELARSLPEFTLTAQGS